jgi:hypothetical protein
MSLHTLQPVTCFYATLLVAAGPIRQFTTARSLGQGGGNRYAAGDWVSVIRGQIGVGCPARRPQPADPHQSTNSACQAQNNHGVHAAACWHLDWQRNTAAQEVLCQPTV